MSDFERRLQRLEEAVAAQHLDDPLWRVQLSLNHAEAAASVPAKPGSEDERQRAARITRLEEALASGDTSHLLPGDLLVHPAMGWE
jgi:hypothetical protein